MSQTAPFDVQQIEKRIGSFEANTGLELIVVATRTSDPYPGAYWRGGLLIGTLLAFVLFHYYEFHPHTWEIATTALLIALSAHILRLTQFHRFFITLPEGARESSEKAAQAFSHFQSQSKGHDASILVFFSMFERKIHLLVGRELKDKLSQEDLDQTVQLMTTHFKQGKYAQGIEASIASLEERVLSKVGKRPVGENKIENKVFWQV